MAKLRENMNESTGPDASAPAMSPNDKRKRKRITVYCNDDGTPDLDSVPEDQRRALGIGQAPEGSNQAPEAPAQFEPAMVGMILPVLVGIEAALIGPRLGIEIDQARSALTPHPMIADGIAQAGAKVLNKYGGNLGRWADEIALVSIIATWQVQAFAEMRRMKAASIPRHDPPPPPPDTHETIETTAKARRPDPIPFPGRPIEDEPML